MARKAAKDAEALARGAVADQKLRERIRRYLLVEPGEPANLKGRDPAWTGGADFAALSAGQRKSTARAALGRGVEELSDAQELLWANDRYALLVVFQAMDAAGKDSTIEHVMSGVNPQGVQVVSFKQPSREELDHDFLWRIGRAAPARGQIGIFNRSHYEEVVAVRVHPEWLDLQRLPPGPRGAEFWQNRYLAINAFERHLHNEGTRVLKFFLNVSKDEQKRRFLSRLNEPDKAWKFSASDVAERGCWDAYMTAFEEAITATSTPWAPWWVIPADHKPVMQALVARIMVETIRSLNLTWPAVSAVDLAAHDRARRQLESEPDE